jgi:hypothetical protein
MLLPNRDKAYVPSDKLSGYLLSESHPVGKSKARFFRAHGYDTETIDLFERDLLSIARTNPLKQVVESPHGIKYTISGTMNTPRGTQISVETVWITEPDDDRPRLVTAYPG